MFQLGVATTEQPYHHFINYLCFCHPIDDSLEDLALVAVPISDWLDLFQVVPTSSWFKKPDP